MESAPESKQSSWLDYIGFGSVKSSATSVPLPSSPIVEPASPTAADTSQDHCPPLAITQERDVNGRHSPVNEEYEEHPPSLLSSQASNSAWYSPWGWYDWYTGPDILTPTAAQDHDGKTDAEIVKEEALARQEDSVSPPEPETIAVASPETSEQEPVNPVSSSIASNSRGWMSFLSVSRTLTVKSLSDKGEGGMEVMEIDEDESAGLASVASPAETLRKKVPSVRNEEPFDPSKSPKETIPAPPLTSSGGAKRAVAEGAKANRGTSPAPSKKSISPPTPRPPNLVLPTFGDTFHALPRSRPPPVESTTYTIKKTLGYVSSVLFARDQEANAEGKGKGRDRRPDLHDFGKELPRAWNVLGEAQEMQTLAACKKVVVIGVHGWFPGLYLPDHLCEHMV